MNKKVLSLILAGACAFGLMACGGSADSGETEVPNDGENQQAIDDVTPEEEETYTIGIAQFAEHGSLDNCREGFIAGLEEEGFFEGDNLTILFDNAQADTSQASLITDSYVSQGVDLICGIATPTAMAAYNSAMDTDIPVIYSAVSDPIAAELADADGKPVGNITGTSDALPVEAQLQMIRQILPDAKKIGILYTTSETNSESTLATYEELAPSYGFEIVSQGVSVIGDVEMAAAELSGKVDCISNLTDNTVVSALQTVLDKANAAGIPVFGSEIEQVRAGCIAAMGLDYIELGKQTGRMAAKVLKGEAKASDLPFEIISEPGLYLNTEAAAPQGIVFSDEMLSEAVEVFDTIEVE